MGFLLVAMLAYLIYSRREFKHYKDAVNLQISELHLRVCSKQDRLKNAHKNN